MTSVYICVVFSELPGIPNKPEIIDVTATSMVVTWEPPEDNGNAITGYWVEKREINSTHWSRANR